MGVHVYIGSGGCMRAIRVWGGGRYMQVHKGVGGYMQAKRVCVGGYICI